MGEDKKEEKKEEKKEDKKDEKKEEKEDKNKGKVIVEARMHCESCRYKVYRAIIGYPGVEDISIDMQAQKVTVKAPTADAKKLFETMKKKSGGKVTKLIYPDPKDLDKKKEEKKVEEKKVEEKKPVDVTVELKVYMHCAACTKKVEKAAWKIGAVYNVNVQGEKVIIKGKDLDPKKVCETIVKKTGKHAEVIPPPKKEEKKDGEKKEEKKDGDKKAEDKKDGEKKEEKKGGEKKEQKKDGDKKGDEKKDGDKKEEKKDGDKKDDIKKEEKQPTVMLVEYVYPPQLFSDENPNACSIM